MICESASHQWASHAGYAEHGAEHSGINRPSLQRDRLCDDDNTSGEETSRADAGYSASDNEGDRSGSHAADQGSEFEYEESAQVDPFGGVEGVEFSEAQGHRTRCQEVRAGIPTHVF